MSDNGNQAFPGQSDVASGNSSYNALMFLMHVFAGNMATATMVQVINVHPGAGLLQGTVDVLPLVNMIDSLGNVTKHDTVHGLPYARVCAGPSAVILDPVGASDGYGGDIGIAVFASRDISSVKANKAQSNPGSFRRFDYADGMYLFTGIGTVDPTQYVEFLSGAGGINFVTPAKITIQSANATLDTDGNLAVSGNVTWDKDGTPTDAINHTHGGVEAGGSNTTKPNPGS